jgi:methylmalonyl-CoA/ethylmalonyl-CoA epimerase
MARILELLTVNIAVSSLDEAIPRYEALGLSPHPPDHMPDPPAEITDVTFGLERGGALSLIAATGEGSPVASFVARRGPGVYSIAFRVDDLAEIMREWSAAGMEWVLQEPHVFHDHGAADFQVERLLMNWVKPRSMGGVMLEVFEFAGDVRRKS